MEEVLDRRYTRLKEEHKTFPDLIIVDGGLNQIAVAQKVLDKLELSIPVAGLAKDKRVGRNYKILIFGLKM